VENNQIIKHEGGSLQRVGNAISITNKLLELGKKPNTSKLMDSAIKEEDCNHYDNAIKIFSTVIDIELEFGDIEDSPCAYCWRGNLKQKLNDYEGAINDWRMASKLGISDADKLLEKYCK